MILYPAIDLKQGKCVRLRQGNMHDATIFNHDPANQAALFAKAGAEWLHLVDLDGAFVGKPTNVKAVRDILAATHLPCQLGGGIRSLEAIENWLAEGVARIILGTVALKDPALVREAARSFSGKIAVGIDARDGIVAVEGWVKSGEISALDLAQRFEGAGVSALIFTDIARDGLMQGVNAEATADLASRLTIPVIASGGVTNMKDIERLLDLVPRSRAKKGGIAGVIVGRALYDGSLDLRQTIARMRMAA